MRKPALLLISVLSLMAASLADEPQCGEQHGGAFCPNGLCCSSSGFCGNEPAYCGDGCQSQCHIDGLISEELFEEMLKHRDDVRCPGKGFYTYDAFISAAKSFPHFGNTGGTVIRKREIVAFTAQTSHQTRDHHHEGEPNAWGYCYVEETWPRGDYCDTSHEEWPCAADKQYYGRGPIQLQYNYNYGRAGVDLDDDLLDYPDDLATNRVLSFKSALWFWMTPQDPKPSCHDVITDQWTDPDTDAGRLPGYGVITNIINGTAECGHGPDDNVKNRIGFYKRYCNLIDVNPGDNLDCYTQKPFDELGLALPM